MLTKEQLERLAELKNAKTLTQTEKAELEFLASFAEPAEKEKNDDSSQGIWGLTQISNLFASEHQKFLKILKSGDKKSVDDHIKNLVVAVAKNIANYENPLVYFEPMKEGKYVIDEVAKLTINNVEDSPEELQNLAKLIKNTEFTNLSLEGYKLYGMYFRSIVSVYSDFIETYHIMPIVYAANAVDVMLLAYLPSTLENLRKVFSESIRNELNGKPYTKDEYRLAFGILDSIKDKVKSYTVNYLRSLDNQQNFGSLDENFKVAKEFAKLGFLDTLSDDVPEELLEVLKKLVDALE